MFSFLLFLVFFHVALCYIMYILNVQQLHVTIIVNKESRHHYFVYMSVLS